MQDAVTEGVGDETWEPFTGTEEGQNSGDACWSGYKWYEERWTLGTPASEPQQHSFARQGWWGSELVIIGDGVDNSFKGTRVDPIS